MFLIIRCTFSCPTPISKYECVLFQIRLQVNDPRHIPQSFYTSYFFCFFDFKTLIRAILGSGFSQQQRRGGGNQDSRQTTSQQKQRSRPAGGIIKAGPAMLWLIKVYGRYLGIGEIGPKLGRNFGSEGEVNYSCIKREGQQLLYCTVKQLFQ